MCQNTYHQMRRKTARESSWSVNPTDRRTSTFTNCQAVSEFTTKSGLFNQTQEEKSSAKRSTVKPHCFTDRPRESHRVHRDFPWPKSCSGTPSTLLRFPLTLSRFRHGGNHQSRAKQKEKENPFLGLAAASPFTLQSRRSPFSGLILILHIMSCSLIWIWSPINKGDQSIQRVSFRHTRREGREK